MEAEVKVRCASISGRDRFCFARTVSANDVAG